MKGKMLSLLAMGAVMFGIGLRTLAGEPDNRFVQLAEIKVDHKWIAAYQAALRREIAATMRLEPGVLSLYAVAHRDDPSSITILEIYASRDAYEAHRQSMSFKTYKAETAHMVQSLRLIPGLPLLRDGKLPSGRNPGMP